MDLVGEDPGLDRNRDCAGSLCTTELYRFRIPSYHQSPSRWGGESGVWETVWVNVAVNVLLPLLLPPPPPDYLYLHVGYV